MLALGGCVQGDQSAVEQGTVLAATPANQPGENSGAGAVAGMVVLGVAGGAVGHGAGQIIAVAAGTIVGAEAGSAIEASAQPRNGIAYTLRLADGQVVTILEHLNAGDPVFAAGASVFLVTNGREQRVLATVP